MGHALMENRSGLIVETETTLADGHAERRAALAMIDRRCPGEKQITLGACEPACNFDPPYCRI